MDIRWKILENLVFYSYVVEYEMLELNPMIMVLLLIFSELRNFAYIFQPIYLYSSWGGQNSILYQYISGITLFYTFINQEFFIILILACSLFYIAIAFKSVYTITFQAQFNNSLTEKKEYLQKHNRYKAVSAYSQLLDIFLINVIFTVVLVNIKNQNIAISIICICINMPVIVLRLYIQNSVCFIIPNNFSQHRYDILDALLLILNFTQIVAFSLQMQPYEIQYVLSLIIGIIKIYSQLIKFNQLIPMFTNLIIIIQTITIIISFGKLITMNLTIYQTQFEITIFIISPLCIAILHQIYEKLKIKLLLSKSITNKKIIFIISYTQSVRQNLIRPSQSIDTAIHILHLRQHHYNNSNLCKCSQQEYIKILLTEFGIHLSSISNSSLFQQILSINVKLFLMEYIQAYILAQQLIIGNKTNNAVQLLTSRNYTMTEIFRDDDHGIVKISVYQRIFLENIKLKCQIAVLRMLNINLIKSNQSMNIQSIVQGDTIKSQIQIILKEALQQKLEFLNVLIGDRTNFISEYERTISKILFHQHKLFNITKNYSNLSYQAAYIFFLAEILQDIQAAYQKSRQQIQQFQFNIKEDEMVFLLCEMVEQSYQLKIVRYSPKTLGFFGLSKIPKMAYSLIPPAIRDYHPHLLENLLSKGNNKVYRQVQKYYATLPNNLIISADAYLDILFSNDQLQFLIIFYARSDPEVIIILNSDQQIVGVNQNFLTEFEIDRANLSEVYGLNISLFIRNFQILKDGNDTHQVTIEVPKIQKQKRNIYKYHGFLQFQSRVDDNGNIMYYVLNIHGLFRTYQSIVSQGKESTENETESIVFKNMGTEEKVISPLDFDQDIISPRDSLVKKSFLQTNTMFRHLSQQDFIYGQVFGISKNEISQSSLRLQKNDNNIQESSLYSMLPLIESKFQKKYDLIHKLSTKILNHNLYKAASSLLIIACIIQIIAFINILVYQQTKFQEMNQNFEVLRIKNIVIQPLIQCKLLRFHIYNYKVYLAAKIIDQQQFTDGTTFAYNNLEYVQTNFQKSVEQLSLNYFFAQKSANLYSIAQYDTKNTSIIQNYSYRNFINALMVLQQQLTQVFVSGSVLNTALPYSLFYFKNYLMIHNGTNSLKFELYNNLKVIFNHLEVWQVQYIIIFYCCSLIFVILSMFIYIQSKRKRLNILSNLISVDVSLYKSEIKHYAQLMDNLENMNIQRYSFNLAIKEQQIKAQQPMKENQPASLSKLKIDLQIPLIIVVHGIACIIICLGLLIVTIYVLEFASKALNTVEFVYTYNDLVYYTGSVYVQRDTIYINPNLGLLSSEMVSRYLNEIQVGLNFIANYNSNPPSTYNLLLSQQFLNTNFNLSQSNICNIDLPGVIGQQSKICQTAFSGILTKGLTQTLSNIVTSLTQEILLNNFTQRLTSLSIDLPGAFVLSEHLNNIDKAMFQEIHQITNDYYNNIVIVSSVYMFILVVFIGFLIYLFNYRLSADMQKSLYFVYFMPISILFYDDSFERKVRGSIIQNDEM